MDSLASLSFIELGLNFRDADKLNKILKPVPVAFGKYLFLSILKNWWKRHLYVAKKELHKESHETHHNGFTLPFLQMNFHDLLSKARL